MSKIVIKNAKVVNERKIEETDVMISGQRIEKVGNVSPGDDATVIDANGKVLMPGMIDDQVHFREPGFEWKGEIKTESAAAVAGGITSYMEMPNTKVTTTTHENLVDKIKRASEKSMANFSFYFGATNDNLDEIKNLNPLETCGLKVFMGSSTGNMLVDNKEVLTSIFKESPVMVVTHCEDTPSIAILENEYKEKYGEDLSPALHAEIRSAEACYKSSSMAVDLAKKHGTQLHVLHLTTAKELELFTPGEIDNKNITAEVCVHHLLFNKEDYARKKHLIKCNPAIKFKTDQDALRKALADNKLDIVATDHAPHTWDEKQRNYFGAPSGMPLVQHAIIGLFELVHDGVISLDAAVEKVTHNVAKRFQVKDRGYITEGYFADLTLVDMNRTFDVTKESILYKCGWSPFDGDQFRSSIDTTIVNGNIVYADGKLQSDKKGQVLEFNR